MIYNPVIQGYGSDIIGKGNTGSRVERFNVFEGIPLNLNQFRQYLNDINIRVIGRYGGDPERTYRHLIHEYTNVLNTINRIPNDIDVQGLRIEINNNINHFNHQLGVINRANMRVENIAIQTPTGGVVLGTRNVRVRRNRRNNQIEPIIPRGFQDPYNGHSPNG